MAQELISVKKKKKTQYYLKAWASLVIYLPKIADKNTVSREWSMKGFPRYVMQQGCFTVGPGFVLVKALIAHFAVN